MDVNQISQPEPIGLRYSTQKSNRNYTLPTLAGRNNKEMITNV